MFTPEKPPFMKRMSGYGEEVISGEARDSYRPHSAHKPQGTPGRYSRTSHGGTAVRVAPEMKEASPQVQINPQYAHRGFEDQAVGPPSFERRISHGSDHASCKDYHPAGTPQNDTPTYIATYGDAEPAAKDPFEESSDRGAEEKIYVTVRVRPLSQREIKHRDVSVWKVPNHHTLQFLEPVPERGPYPPSYHFDRVFGPESQSRQVYAEGAKNVVLSALDGINAPWVAASIFAYGMTSSGKTHTMRAITEAAIVDIFERIKNTPEREYMIRVSALEIYNEVVKDLLCPDTGNLRLLDDPDRGVVVEKLTEEVVQSSFHLRQILSVYQRQVGETSLNDASSRSHQIVRLTVESCPRPPAGLKASLESFTGQVLMASLSLVDLAGSERASQTHSEGTRLKEGGHINRSLLTLGTVIRKLSGGNKTRVGHIPYRDSKLTRILQHSLGGNARTAIICTMSPALGHVDQTRNTLSFATRAKEVTNSAHVNLLEAQVADVTCERDLALQQLALASANTNVNAAARKSSGGITVVMPQSQSRALVPSKSLRRAASGFRKSKKGMCLAGVDEAEESADLAALVTSPSQAQAAPPTYLPDTWLLMEQGAKERRRYRKAVTRSSLALVAEIRKLEHMQDEVGVDAARAMEQLQREIENLRHAQLGMHQDAADTIAKLQHEVASIQQLGDLRSLAGPAPSPAPDAGGPAPSSPALQREPGGGESKQQRGGGTDTGGGDTAAATIAVLEHKLECMQLSLDQLPTSTPRTPASLRLSEADEGNGPVAAAAVKRAASVDVRRMQALFKTAAEENIKSIRAYVTELKERVAKLHYQKQLLVRQQVIDLESHKKTASDDDGDDDDDDDEEEEDDSRGGGEAAALAPLPAPWHSSSSQPFEQEMAAIVALWNQCHVALCHRTHFYLVMKGGGAGSPPCADARVYVDVERRRLLWLSHYCHTTGAATLSASLKALHKERRQLAAKMKARLTEREREQLYAQWGVAAGSKQRKLQLALRLWSDPTDAQQVEASARITARLLAFAPRSSDTGTPKELFALHYSPPPASRT
eukprot:jgi/Mesen1/433/ME001000S10637